MKSLWTFDVEFPVARSRRTTEDIVRDLRTLLDECQLNATIIYEPDWGYILQREGRTVRVLALEALRFLDDEAFTVQALRMIA